jgi:hypothetical protein
VSENLSRDGQSTPPGRGGAAGVGVALIVLGIVYMLQTSGFSLPGIQNWWAFFILIPAVASFLSAWRTYQDRGYVFTREVGSLIGGGIFLMVLAGFFLLGLSFSTLWPVLLIAGGLVALLGAVGRQ